MADLCQACGSEGLFSGFFDPEGLAVPDDSQAGWRWTTYCTDCGQEWAAPAPRPCKGTHTYSGLHDYAERDDGSMVCRRCRKVGRFAGEERN